MKYLWLTFLLGWLLGGANAQNSSQEYIFTRYNTDNGLPQNSVKGLAFDKLGFCWIGTEMGLVRFDGVHFRTVSNLDIPPVSNRVSNIRQLKNGDIIVKIEAGERYRILEEQLTGTRPVFDTARFLEGNGTQIQMVDDPVLDRFYKLSQELVRKGSTDEYYLIGKDELYISTFDSLIIATAQGSEIHLNKQTLNMRELAIVDNKIIVLQNDGQLRILNWNGEYSQPLSRKGGFFENDCIQDPGFSLITSNTSTFGVCKGTLYRLKVSHQKIESVPVLYGLGDLWINEIYEDTLSGNIYLQSYTEGLIIAYKNLFQNLVNYHVGAELNSYYGQQVYQGSQIIANGYLFTEPHLGPPTTVKRLVIMGNQSATLLVGDDYYYEFNFRINRLNLKTRKNAVITEVSNGVTCLQFSPNDSLIFYSLLNEIYLLQGNKSQLVVSLPLSDKHEIRHFQFAGRDSLLIATSQGLWSYQLKMMKVRELIPAINFRNIYHDREGHYWLGSYGNGCFVVSEGQYRQLPIDPLQRMKVINSILEDKKGRIWFSTNNGLLTVEKKTVLDFLFSRGPDILYTIYDKSDGLITSEFNGGATPDKVWLPDGRVSIPSLKGLVLFNPNEMPDAQLKGKIVIDEAILDGDQLVICNPLYLPAGFRLLQLIVSMPWTLKPELRNFEYRLSEVDDKWMSVTDVLQLTGLKKGDYTLYVRVKGFPQSELTLSLKVAPFFYETIWFKLLLFIVLLLTIRAIYFFGRRKLKRENILLDQLVKDRTLVLNESLESLYNTVEQLKRTEEELRVNVAQKEQIISMLLHDMKSPLIALKAGIEELDNRLTGAVGLSTELLNKSRNLREGINDVYSFSVNFFEWVRYQKEGIRGNYQQTRLDEVFDKIRELYGGIARRKGIKLEVPHTGLTLITDGNILLTILRNLVDNSIKNLNQGKVTVYTRLLEDDVLVIGVKDNGPGMPEDLLKKINLAMSEDLPLPMHYGYGYKLILQLRKLIYADIEIENDGGFHVRIYLNYLTDPRRVIGGMTQK